MEVDTEKYRTPYESNAEWRIRERFLKAHLDKFDEARLVCLSHCYLNVRQMGCLYPQEVMKQLNQLGKDICQDDTSDFTNLPSRIKGVEPVKFVRSTDHSDLDNSSSYGPSPPKKTASNVTMNFVKSSSEYKSTDVAMHTDDHQLKTHVSMATNPVHSNRSKGSGLGYGTPKYNTTGISDIDMKFKTLSIAVKDTKTKFGSGKNSIELLQMAVDKTKMCLDCKFKDVVGSQYSHTFICIVVIDMVEVAEGKGTNKKTAKHAAFDSAVASLTCSNVYVNQEQPGKQVLVALNDQTKLKMVNSSNSSDIPKTENASFSSRLSNTKKPQIAQSFARPGYSKRPENTSANFNENSEFYESNFNAISGGKKRTSGSLNGDIYKLILFEHFNLLDQAVALLRDSCNMNKALLEFHYVQEVDGDTMMWRCQIYIEGHFIAESLGGVKNQAKVDASLNAIHELKKFCWTIKIKQNADCPEGDSLSRESVLTDIKKEMDSACISNDNIGNKLLRKMGWSGGGIGVEGNIGREEPVAVSLKQMVRREGLGHESDTNFRSNIRQVIEDYAKSETQQDIVFSSEFTKEERAYIHSLSLRYGLKSSSSGKGDNRYLTLRRKRTSNQLFDHLVREGGSTHKYDLIPPGNGEN